MKKIAFVTALILVLSILIVPMSAAGKPISVVVNGKKLVFPDAQPFIDANGRVQTPARFIGEALGATVYWDKYTRKATFESGSKKIVLTIGRNEYEVGGIEFKMDTAAVLKNSRTFVPARYIGENLGAVVKWDEKTYTVVINVNKDAAEGKAKVVAGFVVPKGIDLTVVGCGDDPNGEALFQIDYLRPDVEKQKDDMEKIMLQRFSPDTVKQVMAYVRTKKDAMDTLAEKYFYDSKTKQYIKVAKSWPIEDSDIAVWILKRGVKP